MAVPTHCAMTPPTLAAAQQSWMLALDSAAHPTDRICSDALVQRVAARALRVRSSKAARPPEPPRRAHRRRPARQARAAC